MVPDHSSGVRDHILLIQTLSFCLSSNSLLCVGHSDSIGYWNSCITAFWCTGFLNGSIDRTYPQEQQQDHPVDSRTNSSSLFKRVQRILYTYILTITHQKMSSTASFWDFVYETFLASIRSVGTACTLAAAGTYMHQRGLISVPGKRMLALMSQQVTFPLFLFTKIIYCNQDWSTETCPSVTRSLRQVWILVFWPIVLVSLGLLVGHVVSSLCRTPPHQRKSVMAAVAFGNSTGLPITLLTVVHTNFSKTSELGQVDPTLFLSVYLLLYPVLQWGLGGWLLAPTSSKSNHTNRNDVEQAVVPSTQKEAPSLPASPEPSAVSTSILTEPVLTTAHDDDNDKDRSAVLTSLQLPEMVVGDGEGQQLDDGTLMVPLVDASSSLSSSPPRRGMRSVRSSFKINVLNNKSLDEQYLRHRQGLYSSDEGLYLSEVNLNTLEEQQQQQLHVANTAMTRSVPEVAAASASHAVNTTTTTTTTRTSSTSSPSPPTTDVSSEDSTTAAEPFLLYDETPDSPPHSSDPEPTTTTPHESLDTLVETQPLLTQYTTSSSTTTSPPSSTVYGSTANFSSLPFRRNHNNNSKTTNQQKTIGTVQAPPPPAATESTSPSFSEHYKVDSIWTSFRNIAERCLQPPVVGAITGILVAISPARGLFVDVVDRDADAPLEWLFDGLYSIGLTAVPINMIILGCNLSNSYNKLVKHKNHNNNNKSNGGGGGTSETAVATMSKEDKDGLLDFKTMIGIVIGKMMVMPAMGFVLAWILDNYILDIPDDIDAAFYLVLLIVFLTPTANNVMVMVELSGSNTKEGIANVIAMQFAVAPIILSCTLTMAIGYARGMQ